ncbi:MAG TPA: prepilin peptidase [Candidatus Absconditabacterales bacterium]|nr:prepilin peptidase [Candidatus Absconditabacterales bacterium]
MEFFSRVELLILFVLGTLFGSFGSVILLRLGKDFSVEKLKKTARGRSECPDCHHQLSWKNLIPLYSFLAQGGECSFCGKKISLLYPFLEIALGVIFVLTAFFVGSLIGRQATTFELWLTMAIFLATNWGLFLIVVWDIMTYELHLPVWILVTFFSLFPQFLNLTGNYQIAFASSLLLGGIFYLIFWGSKLYVKKKYNLDNQEGFGEGDVFLAFTLGGLFPFIFESQHISFSFLSLFSLAFWFVLLACLFGLVSYFFFHKQKLEGAGDIIPFLPAMVASFWTLMLVARWLV